MRVYKIVKAMMFFSLLSIFAVNLSIAQSRIEETPFLWFGRSYSDPQSGRPDGVVDIYGDLPYIFSNASSCLSAPISPNEDIINKNLAWEYLKTYHEVEICLFRVLTRLSDIEKIVEWMQRQGWTQVQIMDMSNLSAIYNSQGPLTQLIYYWDISKKGSPFGSESIREDVVRKARSAVIEVIFDDHTGVVQVTMNIQSNWSK
jgi:hypothetical protein